MRRICLITLATCCLVPLGAQEEKQFTVTGTSESEFLLAADDLVTGAVEKLRLNLDWKPDESVHMRVETLFEGQYGYANDLGRMVEAGPAAPDPQGMFPFEDFHWRLALEKACGTVLVGPFDIQAGVFPLGWGTGYLFNPTARTAPYKPGFFAEQSGQGVLGLSVTLNLPLDLALQVYGAFQERTRQKVALFEEGDAGYLPFGAKLQYRSGALDCSLSFFKETLYAGGWLEHYYAGFDASLVIDAFEFYAEAAYRLPLGRTDEDRPWEPVDDLEICAGGNVLVPGIEVTVRLEYAHIGSGSADSAAYDWAGLVGGTRASLGRDYLFLMLERDFGAIISCRVGGLCNLNDGSLAAAAELEYKPTGAVTIGLYGLYCWGEDNAEMNGEFMYAPGMYADLLQPQAGVKVKFFF